MTGLAVVDPLEQKQAEQQSVTRSQVVRDLALDFQYALSRKGLAPFILSGLPMFDDLCALHQTLEQCLALGDDPHLHHWYLSLIHI